MTTETFYLDDLRIPKLHIFSSSFPHIEDLNVTHNGKSIGGPNDSQAKVTFNSYGSVFYQYIIGNVKFERPFMDEDLGEYYFNFTYRGDRRSQLVAVFKRTGNCVWNKSEPRSKSLETITRTAFMKNQKNQKKNRQ